MLRIRDTNTVPFEDWTFVLDGQTFSTKNYTLLYPKIIQFCQSNNVTAPSEQEVIDYLCVNSHIPCFEDETREPLINKWSLGVPVPPRPGGCCH